MKTKDNIITLGQAFALIYFEKGYKGSKKIKFSQNENRFLDSIQKKSKSLNALKSIGKFSDQNNEEQLNDWFIDLFLNIDSDEGNVENIKLLNSSFQLFEKFNQIFMDYINKTQNLKKEYND